MSAEGCIMPYDVFSDDTPAGFRNTMSANRQAMDVFIGISDEERRALIEGARNVRSKAEMKSYVNRIGGFKTPHGPVQL